MSRAIPRGLGRPEGVWRLRGEGGRAAGGAGGARLLRERLLVALGVVVAASRELFSLGVGMPRRSGAPISAMIIVMAFGIEQLSVRRLQQCEWLSPIVS